MDADPLSPLHAHADLAQVRERFAREGRVTLEGVLEPSFAAALHARLSDWRPWALVAIVGGRHRNFNAAAMEVLPPEQRAEFEALVAEQARNGMQYLYERYPLLDAGRPAPPDPLLARLHAWLSSERFLAPMRKIVGDPRVAFVDAQLTRYRRGHYLTLHDDHAPGKNRAAAYVLGLTRDWASDYGGQLQFVEAGGKVQDSVVPGFNTLTLFRVPRPHLVSAVAPFVAGSRLSVTGWLHR